MPVEDDPFDDLARRRRGRVLAVAAILAAAALALWWFNRAADPGPVLDCGDLDARAADAPPLPHDRHCTLRGTVQTPLVLTMGRENEDAVDEATRKAPLRYFVKLPGPVVAALPGGRPDIEAYRRERAESDLRGFVVEGVGRVFDPAREKGYGGTAQALRKHFGLAEGAPMRVFDAADRPDR